MPFTKEFQEELFSYLSSEAGFSKYGLLIPNDIFTIEYLDIAWVELLKFFGKFKSLPTQAELYELVERSEIPDKLKPIIISSLRDVFSKEEVVNTHFIEEKLIDYIKRAKTEFAIQDFLEVRDTEGKVELYELIQKLSDINSFMLPTAENYFDTLSARLEKYKIPTDEALINIGLGPICVGRGELGVVLAPPKRGKSLFLISAGYGALISGHKVLHVTLELRKPAVELRYDRAISGLCKGKLNNIIDKSQVEGLFNRIKRLGGGVDIYEFPAGKTSVDVIYGLVNRELKRGNPYDLIIVDYGDLVLPNRRYTERRHELSLIYTELRALASEFDVAIWTASQTKRETLEASIITMADVSEDIGKVAICDMAVAVCQTREERQNMPETGRLFIAGAREALDGVTIPCVLDRDLSRVLVRAA